MQTLGLIFAAFLCSDLIFAFAPLQRLGGTKKSVEPSCAWNRAFVRRRVATQDGAEIDLVSKSQSSSTPSRKKIGRITFLIPSAGADEMRLPFGSKSPVGNPSLGDAVNQLARKATWFADDQVETHIVPTPSIQESKIIQELITSTDVLLAIGLSSQEDLDTASHIFSMRREQDEQKRFRQCQFALNCNADASDNNLPSFVGPYDHSSPSPQSTLLPWTIHATGRRLHEQMSTLFDKWSSDEFVFAIMIFLNQFSGSEVDWVKHSVDATWEKGPVRNAQEIYSMVSKCGDCIVACVQDEKCAECLGKLTALDTRDQVASYRTIVSYESDLLRDFSFCILQKNNIFNCAATIPELPVVRPITSFRGEPLTEELARSILVGHLDDEAAFPGTERLQVSWKVACGANEAYDKFPSQNQVFYPAEKGRAMWYDPVFRVETLDGRHVWCKRHYKVRPQRVPGTFRFSVLDNGITSDEFWTIVAVADDLSWIVFHYAGAAGAVGMRYLGGLLCTADGSLPDQSKLPKVWEALHSAGIEPFELFIVDNDTTSQAYLTAGEPPLDYFRKDVLAKKEL